MTQKRRKLIHQPEPFPFLSIITDIQKHIVAHLIDEQEFGRKYRLKHLLAFRSASRHCRDISVSFLEVVIKLELSEELMSWEEISIFIQKNTVSTKNIKAIHFNSPLHEKSVANIFQSISSETFSNITRIQIRECDYLNDRHIQYLPDQITTLIIRECGRKLSNEAVKIIRDRFTQLTTLHIFGILSISDITISYLPSGLTELKIGHLCDASNDGMKYLSKLTNLTNLELSIDQRCTNAVLGYMPRSLTRLVYFRNEETGYNSLDDASVPLLPPNLKTLRIGGENACQNLSPMTLTKLPQRIQFLDIKAASLEVPILHENITALTIWKFSSKTQLPPRLEYLSVDEIKAPKVFMKQLPKTLEVLQVGSAEGLNLKLLPESLKHFEVKNIRQDENIDFADLPRGLLYLKGGCQQGNVEDLPPHLIKLGLRTDRLSFKGVEKIPATVRCLSLYKVNQKFNEVDAKDFSLIPSHVTHLKLNRIHIWKKMDHTKFPSTIKRLLIKRTKELQNIPPTLTQIKVDPNNGKPKKAPQGIQMKRLLPEVDSDEEEDKEPIRSFSVKLLKKFDKQN